MRPVIAGNWKMNGSLDLASAVMAALRRLPAEPPADIVLCAPATLLSNVAQMLAGTAIAAGGQDCHAALFGAYTGDVSATMLREAGARWVILGHSERRAGHGETDEQVRRKVLAAQAAGLTPIVCVGETADQRRADTQTDVVGWQLEGSLPKDFAGVVAYEPVWAIGTGRVPRPEEVAAMHAFIRAELLRQLGAQGRGVRILYGGSVNAANAAGLLAIAEVGGALVGGASLDAQAFVTIAQAAGTT